MMATLTVAANVLGWVCGVLNALLCGHTFVNSRLLRRPSISGDICLESVTVCIPARDEQDNIGDCLQSVLQSAQVPDLHIIVFDDDSSDATAAVVTAIAQADHRVTLCRSTLALPPQWLGKPWACQQLLDQSSGWTNPSDIIVFVDADVRLEPAAICSGIALLRAHNMQMVCPYPRQRAMTWGERLVQPLLQWLWLTFLPLRIAERPRPLSMTAANGQFMIIDRNALNEIDGFRSVANNVLDDVALAKEMKRAGMRAGVVDGTRLATCRMYRGWKELRDGYSKNLWAGTGTKLAAFGLGSFLVLVYLLPWLLLLGAVGTLRLDIGLVACVSIVLSFVGRVISAHNTGANKRDALLHPASIVTLLYLLTRSWRLHRRRALAWKGRSIDIAPTHRSSNHVSPDHGSTEHDALADLAPSASDQVSSGEAL